MSFTRNYRFGTVFAFLLFISCALYSAPYKAHATEDLNREAPLISDEINRYLVMDFVPKFRVNECVIRFQIHLKRQGDKYLNDVNLAFWRYLNKYEPRIGTMIYLNWNWPDHYVYFADQCDRRDSIFTGMAANVEKHFGDRMRIEVLPVEKPVTPFMSYWTDSPEYSPERHAVFQKGMRKDGEAFLKLIEYIPKDNYQQRHLYYALAEHYLPDGALKNTAEQERLRLESNFSLKQMERQRAIVGDWISKIQGYNTN